MKEHYWQDLETDGSGNVRCGIYRIKRNGHVYVLHIMDTDVVEMCRPLHKVSASTFATYATEQMFGASPPPLPKVEQYADRAFRDMLARLNEAVREAAE